MKTKAISVSAWGFPVGAIAPDPSLGYYVFAYEPSWLRRGIELAPQAMPVRTYRTPHAFPNLPEATYHRLPAMVADSMPDTFGNALINAWMASKGYAPSEVTTLDRLAYMGKRSLGALEFKPARGSRTDSRDAIDMQSLVETARLAVKGDLSDDKFAQAALTQLIKVGTSAGGARAKAVIAWSPTTQEVRSGQFDVPVGFEHWLIKFDGVDPDLGLGPSQPYGRIEYAYHLMAKAAGIEMSPCRLLEENGRAHFMTKRFDRDANKKHHTQTLCAMEHLDYKQKATHAYAQAFMAVANLGLGPDATDELFRRMVFNVAARNCDDHTKNLSFILKQGGSWALAPAYDLIFAFNPAGEWNTQHLMSVNNKFDGITKADLLVEASRFGVRNAGSIIATVTDAVASFDQFAKAASVPSPSVDKIRPQFRTL